MLLDGDFGPIPEELFPTLNSLRDQNLHLIHLVENLLNLARIEAGKQTDHPEPTHLVEVVQRCFEILEPHAQDRHITLKLEILSIPHPTVNLDPEKLTEIFQNLLTNAVKYNNPGGSVTVTISPQVQFVVVTITDTGIGISEVDQPKLFTKFFRTEAASRYDTEGTGLGLYVVKSYIEAWGGSIKVTSREWQGSTFTLTLPYQPQTV
jgi:two-component system sensor histidine kinase BaeS